MVIPYMRGIYFIYRPRGFANNGEDFAVSIVFEFFYVSWLMHLKKQKKKKKFKVLYQAQTDLIITNKCTSLVFVVVVVCTAPNINWQR